MLLALRLTVPEGYMPAWGDGPPAIVVCDDWLGAHHSGVSGHDGRDDGSNKQPCPYAIAAGMAADVYLVSQDLGQIDTDTIAAPPHLAAVGRGLAAPPPPPTGPPLA